MSKTERRDERGRVIYKHKKTGAEYVRRKAGSKFVFRKLLARVGGERGDEERVREIIDNYRPANGEPVMTMRTARRMERARLQQKRARLLLEHEAEAEAEAMRNAEAESRSKAEARSSNPGMAVFMASMKAKEEARAAIRAEANRIREEAKRIRDEKLENTKKELKRVYEETRVSAGLELDARSLQEDRERAQLLALEEARENEQQRRMRVMNDLLYSSETPDNFHCPKYTRYVQSEAAAKHTVSFLENIAVTDYLNPIPTQVYFAAMAVYDKDHIANAESLSHGRHRDFKDAIMRKVASTHETAKLTYFMEKYKGKIIPTDKFVKAFTDLRRNYYLLSIACNFMRLVFGVVDEFNHEDVLDAYYNNFYDTDDKFILQGLARAYPMYDLYDDKNKKLDRRHLSVAIVHHMVIRSMRGADNQWKVWIDDANKNVMKPWEQRRRLERVDANRKREPQEYSSLNTGSKETNVELITAKLKLFNRYCKRANRPTDKSKQAIGETQKERIKTLRAVHQLVAGNDKALVKDAFKASNNRIRQLLLCVHPDKFAGDSDKAMAQEVFTALIA